MISEDDAHYEASIAMIIAMLKAHPMLGEQPPNSYDIPSHDTAVATALFEFLLQLRVCADKKDGFEWLRLLEDTFNECLYLKLRDLDQIVK
jgi:hypothetical protein